jgi:hypothetical protein
LAAALAARQLTYTLDNLNPNSLQDAEQNTQLTTPDGAHLMKQEQHSEVLVSLMAFELPGYSFLGIFVWTFPDIRQARMEHSVATLTQIASNSGMGVLPRHSSASL